MGSADVQYDEKLGYHFDAMDDLHMHYFCMLHDYFHVGKSFWKLHDEAKGSYSSLLMKNFEEIQQEASQQNNPKIKEVHQIMQLKPDNPLNVKNSHNQILRRQTFVQCEVVFQVLLNQFFGSMRIFQVQAIFECYIPKQWFIKAKCMLRLDQMLKKPNQIESNANIDVEVFRSTKGKAYANFRMYSKLCKK